MLDHVFRPGTIGRLRLPHRIVMGAMHLNLETRDDDGAALAAFYAERVQGGAGLIVTGGSAVSPAGAGGPGYGVLTDPAHRSALGTAVRAVHEAGGAIASQLFHAGRYALPGVRGVDGPPLAPSAVPSRFARSTPREMTPEEITGTIADFARGAATARALGFDAVEVMGSEGYLINQFTAPLTNRRTDDWGGDAGRRRRFPLAVLRAVREAVGPDFPVLFRISVADLITGGTPELEVLDLAIALADEADALAVGVGWHESPVPTVQAQVPAGAWARHAATVKHALAAAGRTGVAVIAANRFDRLEQADTVLAAGQADFVAMARPFLADPAIVAKSRAGRAGAVELCIACNEACIDRSFGDEVVSCLVNPRSGHELEFPAHRTSRPARRYAVIGAGPAGLEAARTLARAGHQVEVFEAAEGPGGQFRFAAMVPGKAAFGEAIRRRVGELTELGVTLRLGHRVDAGDVPALAALDGVVVTTGVLPRRPRLSGAELPHVLDYPAAFADPAVLGPRVAVIGGGGIAVDLAHLLTGSGRDPLTAGDFPAGWATAERSKVDVTIMRRSGRIGAGVGASTRWVVLAELRAAGVRMLTGLAYREITTAGVSVVDGAGAEFTIPADHVVMAAGQVGDTAVSELLSGAGVPFVAAGGAAAVTALNAVRATAEGLRAAHEIARR
ncbi:NADPH-dependent 2,4-dienoyl-CoA reductase [Paractinoplanes ferrugineus]|uniref:NADPH-dependent 2,4-dienoyl-CoA reductase n=1 Tax=Paractinoplanes ferrugineus TaxID=113564 RepID=A0A919J3M6_9ACTN|nr:FAD-dependent oxidoreductase [Actinoplanes ferrugineus]GIE12757.1 NADPH-dependent 2,4-dienoyl-CoA reductase [Actinoplanes ferrugineus]